VSDLLAAGTAHEDRREEVVLRAAWVPESMVRGGRTQQTSPVADGSSCWAGSDTELARTLAIMEFLTLCDFGLPVPSDAPFLISPPLDNSDRIRKRLEVRFQIG
jgi:hypothetical protein